MKSFSLQGKLIAVFFIGAFFLLVVGGLGIYSVQDVASNANHVTGINLPNATHLTEMRGNARTIFGLLFKVSHEGPKSPQRESLVKDIEAALVRYQEADKSYNALEFVPGEQELYDKQNNSWKEVVKKVNDLLPLARTGSEDDFELYRSILGSDVDKVTLQHNQDLMKLVDFQKAEADAWIAKYKQAEKQGIWLAILTVALGFILSLANGFFFARFLSNSLSKITNQIAEEAQSVASTSVQISSAGTELSASVDQQASAIQETMASTDEINAMVAKNNENAIQSQQETDACQKNAQNAQVVVKTMMSSIEDISKSNQDIMEQIDHSNKEISAIVQIITEISAKTKVINDIVFQTKLLSFNASVEAARAGESGKGFSVVAEEVGNLAQMSGNAAKEISDLLDHSIHKVEDIVKNTQSRVSSLMANGKAKVEAGVQTAQQCEEVLSEIFESVNKVNSLMKEIATASTEQAKGIQEISGAMGELDKGTQLNSKAAQQTAEGAERMTMQASNLKGIVADLMMIVKGAQASTELAPQSTVKRTEKPVMKSSAKAEVIKVDFSIKSKPSAPTKVAAGSDVVPDANDPRFDRI